MNKSVRVIAACGVVALAFAGGNARAGLGNGEQISVCGKWVLKLRDYGKIKVKDYYSWVPQNFQQLRQDEDPLNAPLVGDTVTPEILFVFNTPSTFSMLYNILDQQGKPIQPQVFGFRFLLGGDYTQKGRKLRFEVNPASILSLEDTFAVTAVNSLFGNRDLVTDIPFATITNPNRLRFKGRINGDGDELKVKFNASMLYDIQYLNDSEFADIFDAEGRMKLRARTKTCAN